ncbi:MAG: carboxylating nicotinate-nucleotide diphosphorylase [Acidobacteria bacterium]|nr:carboxylating nicotinate-nucleotide diphosphorylase [Acidobacteriota bacterium]
MEETPGTPLDPELYRDLVRRALVEDVGPGDVTTSALVPSGAKARATLLAKSTCVLAGLDVAREVCAQVDGRMTWTGAKRDGELCQPGDVIASFYGPASSVLVAERTMLNFLQHLSGIATLTRHFVDAANGALTILDTRKTVPTLRALAKYAVRCGGGVNHRFGLFDGVLIKDNHIRIAGSIAEAVRRVRETIADQVGQADQRRREWAIEVETQSLIEVDQAVEAGVDVIMLDNLSTEDMREAVRRIAGRARIEVSGGIQLDRLAELTTLGVDCVSIGALTHSAPAVDICLDIEIA